MNSMSKRFKDDCNLCHKAHIDDCEPSRKFESKVALKCGTPGSVTIPAASAAGTTFTAALLTVNTNCFSNPCIKLEFTCNPILTAFVGVINLQIFKICTNQLQPRPIGPIYSMVEPTISTKGHEFGFSICDCDICSNDCCTYTVVATVATTTAGVMVINGGILSGLIIDSSNECC